MADEGDDLVGSVLEDVVAAVSEAVDLGPGKYPLPFGKEVVVENEVLVAPADQHRAIAKDLQPRCSFRDDVVAGVTGPEGDVLHEPQGGDPIRPAVVWGAVGIAHFF